MPESNFGVPESNLESSGVKVNVEIKARSSNHDGIRRVLEGRGARFVGKDHQVDTYFNVSEGRLKLREGNIENSLIFYKRSNQSGPKQSDVVLVRVQPDPALRAVLSASNGVKVVVDKQREIWFDGNVKFHLDQVEGLGSFVEIEAIDADGSKKSPALEKQCRFYMDLFGIVEADLIDRSYSDLLIERPSD